ncbi:MAG: MBL fold metallo-hydrolase [Pontibacterium sp.]
MKLDILGCSGGIGKGLKTTTFLVDDTLVIDAGTGLELLDMAQMLTIRSIVITHAHLDHIVGLPLMLATIYDRHQQPIDVYALPQVIGALKTHIFNWIIWPDYTQLPEANPILKLHPLNVGETLEIQGKQIQVLPAEHPTPTAGYLISDKQSSFAFTGDNGCNNQLWPILNTAKPDLLIIDVSFTDDQDQLARLSGHLTPAQLATQLAQFKHSAQIKITHLKPGLEEAIIQQCHQHLPDRSIERLQSGDLIIL